MVKDRVMRRYYGVAIAVPFGKGDPEKFKFRAKDGTLKCSNVLDWFVSKVPAFRRKELTICLGPESCS